MSEYKRNALETLDRILENRSSSGETKATIALTYAVMHLAEQFEATTVSETEGDTT